MSPFNACSASRHDTDPKVGSPSSTFAFSTDGERVNGALTVNKDFS
jgi:hypothetical protein